MWWTDEIVQPASMYTSQKKDKGNLDQLISAGKKYRKQVKQKVKKEYSSNLNRYVMHMEEIDSRAFWQILNWSE